MDPWPILAGLCGILARNQVLWGECHEVSASWVQRTKQTPACGIPVVGGLMGNPHGLGQPTHVVTEGKH